MDSEDFTPRNITKEVAKSIVAFKVTRASRNVISDHTRFDNDAMFVNIGAGLVGSYVAHKCSPITNKVVDTTFDFVAEKIAARRTKNTEKDSTEK